VIYLGKKIIDQYTNMDISKEEKYRLRHPDKIKEYQDNYNDTHKEQKKEWCLNHPEYDPAKWTKEHPEEHKAIACKSMKKARLENPEVFRLRDETNYKKDRKKRINATVNARKNFRIKLITLLGGKCVNPYGFDHSSFEKDIDYMHCLQVDHIDGSGAEDRKETKDSYMMYRRMYKEVENGSKEYQCLCSNCNWLKRQKNKEYH
jgi:hypothetical protein